MLKKKIYLASGWFNPVQAEELTRLVQEVERAWLSLGQVSYGPTEAEMKSLVFRRSIYVATDISEGDVFTCENIRIVRPGDGASPHLYDLLLGRQARRSYTCGTPLSLDQLL